MYDELLHNKQSAPVFLAKIREFEQAIREERKHLSQRYRELANNQHEQWFLEIAIENSQERLKEYETGLKKFTYYHHVALGHHVKEQIDLQTLKQTSPEFLLGKPEYKHARLWSYKCPLHSEQTASFYWYVKTFSYYCFGCMAHGDIIDLVQKMHHVDFKTACKELQLICG